MMYKLYIYDVASGNTVSAHSESPFSTIHGAIPGGHLVNKKDESTRQLALLSRCAYYDTSAKQVAVLALNSAKNDGFVYAGVR